MRDSENNHNSKYAYIRIINNDCGDIVVCFNIENDKVFSIGETMSDICEDAYMNGYNWDAFLHYYLKLNDSDILNGMETDPEAGSYVAYYKCNFENEERARRLKDTIVYLIENKNVIFNFLRKNGDEIEWD